MVTVAKLNFNMGCIEIKRKDALFGREFWLNFNMGCIEMVYAMYVGMESPGLNFNMGCIEMKKTGKDAENFIR